MEKRSLKECQSLYQNMKAKEKGEDKNHGTIYEMQGADGAGEMTVYEVYPGIEIIYDRFEAGEYSCDQISDEDIMEINHCRSGRCEFQVNDKSFLYMGEGDMTTCVLSEHPVEMGFPLKYYSGVSMMIYLDKAQESIKTLIPDLSIDLYQIKKKLCPKNRLLILRANKQIEVLFEGLYHVPTEMKKAYFKIKVLELILFLYSLDNKQAKQNEHYTKQQVSQVKMIKEFITSHPRERYTIEWLAKEFAMSKTALKVCFKGVYGKSIAAYTKEYKMKLAAYTLREDKMGIADVAASVGYENPSKFASAFRESIGMSPNEYRKQELDVFGIDEE